MNSKVLVVLLVIGAAFVLNGNVQVFNSDGGDSSSVDSKRATAAVAAAGATMNPNTPAPSPNPGPKPPRKDCIYCKGTGFVTHGDGHRTPCTYCEAPKGPDPFVAAKKCCPHCDCGPSCGCEYAGQCLVEANGGKPVQICDDRGCAIYAPPSYKLPEEQPPVDNEVVAQLDALVDKARASFSSQDYLGTLSAVQDLERTLLPLPDNNTFAHYRKLALYARMNLDKKLSTLDKEKYQKFIDDYNGYMERNNERLKELLDYKTRAMNEARLEVQDGGCTTCNPTGYNYGTYSRGEHSFMRFGEGRPAYSNQSFAPPNNFGGWGVYYGDDGSSCSSCR